MDFEGVKSGVEKGAKVLAMVASLATPLSAAARGVELHQGNEPVTYANAESPVNDMESMSTVDRIKETLDRALSQLEEFDHDAEDPDRISENAWFQRIQDTGAFFRDIQENPEFKGEFTEEAERFKQLKTRFEIHRKIRDAEDLLL